MILATLSNGKIVGNFSSPHPFVFTDGTILPECDASVAEQLKVTFNEIEHTNGDVELSFDLSDDVWAHLLDWQRAWQYELVHVCFIPLPMMTALKDRGYNVRRSPFRVVRIENRVKKLISIDKQCI